MAKGHGSKDKKSVRRMNGMDAYELEREFVIRAEKKKERKEEKRLAAAAARRARQYEDD